MTETPLLALGRIWEFGFSKIHALNDLLVCALCWSGLVLCSVPSSTIPVLSEPSPVLMFSKGPPDKIPPPTRPLPTVPPHRSVPPVDPRKNDRPKPPRPPTGRPSYPGAKPNICDGNFNTLAILRREMFVFKVGDYVYFFLSRDKMSSVVSENKVSFILSLPSRPSHS